MKLQPSLRAALPLAALVLFLAGCASSPVTVPADRLPGDLPEPLARFAAPGAAAVTVSAGELESAYGCTVAFEVHEPAGRAGEIGPAGAAGQAGAAGLPTVILAHGFMRSLEAMRGWASHWASHGVRTVVVSFCNSSWLNGRHDRNADDLRAVADAVLAGETAGGLPGAAGNRVIYAGFSAGGLAAMLAAADDPRAVACLGLDAVDSGDLAVTAAPGLPPALLLLGEPSSCNADGNMLPRLAEMPDATALRVPFATHCDFENPYDPACARICGSVTPQDTALAIRETILAVATGWIAAAGDPDRAAAEAVIAALESARRVVRLQ